MKIVARVFDLSITQTELDYAVKHVINPSLDASLEILQKQALSGLIDEYLLMHEALEHGVQLDEDEFDNAFMQFLDEDLESSEASVLINRKDRAKQIERLIRSKVINSKYIRSICDSQISDEELYQYYLDSIALFTKEPEVRASHILIKDTDNKAPQKALELRQQIRGAEDFKLLCTLHSICPSGASCGDLGYFKRGIMLPELDEVAFSMQVSEISQPFQTHYGYHILMVTDKIEGHTIPFDTIRESLRETMISMKRNLTVQRLLSDIQQRYADAIKIF